MTTVGYNEIHELDLGGRIAAVVIFLGGAGIVFYLAGTTADALIEGSIFWRRRAARLVKRMSGHFFVGEVSAAAGTDILPGEAEVGAGSSLAGETLRGSGVRQELDIIVTAILKREGSRSFNPSPDESIPAGDLLIAMGRPAALDRLSELARGEAGREMEGAAV